MQVTTISTQLGLGSELVDWYRDATSDPFDHSLIDLSLRTDNRLRFCTNTVFIPSKLSILDRLKQSEILDNQHTKSLYPPNVPIIFPQKQSLFLQSCPREFIRFLCDCIINLLEGNLQNKKTYHLAKFQSEVRLWFPKRTTWKQRRDI